MEKLDSVPHKSVFNGGMLPAHIRSPMTRDRRDCDPITEHLSLTFPHCDRQEGKQEGKHYAHLLNESLRECNDTYTSECSFPGR